MRAKKGLQKFENFGIISMLVLTLFILISSYNVTGEIVTVCSAGCNYTTLQNALDYISDDDSIYINGAGVYSASGTYNINTSIAGTPIIEVNVSNVELSGFNLAGNLLGFGIKVDGKNNVSVDSVGLSYLKRGLFYTNSIDSIINNNNFIGNEYGVLFNNVDNSILSFNNYSANNYGANSILDSDSNLIYENIYLNNNYSLALDSSDSSIIENESIDSSALIGIRFDSSVDNVVKYSSITNSFVADIYAAGSTSNNSIIETTYDIIGAYNSNTYINVKEEYEIKTRVDGSFIGGVNVYIRDSSEVNTGDCAGGFCITNATGSTGVINLTTIVKNNVTENILTPLNIYATNLTHAVEYDLSDFGQNVLTLDLVELDLISPVVSSVGEITSNGSVEISFATDENTTYVINYHTSNSTLFTSGSQVANNTLDTTHVKNISNLVSNTTYYYHINASDSSGNYNDSYYGTFTTNATLDLVGPVITIIKPTSMQTFGDYEGIEFEITTNEYADCNVTSYIGETFNLEQEFMNVSNGHNYFYRKFIPVADSTGYDNYLKAECIDQSENVATNTVYFRVLDNEAPTVNFLSPSPSDNRKTNITYFDINVTTSETMASGFPRYNFNNGTDISMIANTGNGVKYYTFSKNGLAEGEYNYVIIARDNKGNERNYTRTFIVDQSGPDIRVIYPEEDMAIDSCTPDPFNISMKEKSECSYILYFDDEQGADSCNEVCDEDKSECLDDAYDEDDEDNCEDEFDDCEADCAEDRYQSRKEADMEETYDPPECRSDCEDSYDTCLDTCEDEENECLDSAYDPDSREYCNDERDNCEEDCGEKEDSCKDDCTDVNLYVYTEDETFCFGNGNFVIEYTCVDEADNKAVKNETFTITDQSPPIVTSSSPNGSVSYSPITIKVYTDEKSDCRIDDTDDLYENLGNKMIGSEKSHSFNLMSLPIGNYSYYVRCNDTLGNPMKSSHVVKFDVVASGIQNTDTSSSSGGSVTTPSSDPLTKKFSLLMGGKEQAFTVDSNEVSVNEIIIVAKVDKPDVTLKVSKSNLKTGMISPVIDKVYEYFEITKENIANSDLDSVVIKYGVPKSWLNDNKVTSDQIVLHHYNEVIKEWQDLTASKISEDASMVYYKSETNALSLFALGAKNEADSTAEPAITEPVDNVEDNATNKDNEKDANEENPEDVKNSSNFVLWIIIALCSLVVVGGGTAGFVLLKKHPQQNKVNSTTAQLPSEDKKKDQSKTEQTTEEVNAAPVAQINDNDNNLNQKEGVITMDINKIAYNVTKDDQQLSYVYNCMNSNMSLANVVSALENAGYTRENIKALFDRMGLADDDITVYINNSTSAGVDKLSLHKALTSAGYANEYVMEKFIALGIEQNEIISYVENTLKSGYDEAQIASILVQQGYDQAYSNMLLSGVKAKIRREVFASKKDQTVFDLRSQMVNESYQTVNPNANTYDSNVVTNNTYAEPVASSVINEPERQVTQSNVASNFKQEPNVVKENKTEEKTAAEKYLDEAPAGIDEDLLDYAKASLKEGMSKYHLKKVMIKAGHDKESVKLHIDTAKNQLRDEGFKKSGFLGFFS